MTTDKRPATGPVPPPRGKISEALLAGGTEPDPRFTLANERTFLDWVIPALSAPYDWAADLDRDFQRSVVFQGGRLVMMISAKRLCA